MANTSIEQVADMIAKLGNGMATLAENQTALGERLAALESSPKASKASKASNGKTPKAKAPAKLAIDFTRIEGHERTTTKARANMERWGKAQNIERLQCYAGVRACPHDEPHNVAVVESNKAFAVKLLAHLQANTTPAIRTRKARSEIKPDENQVETEMVHTSPKARKRARKS